MTNKKTLRNKADKLMQEVGREKYKSCLVCGNPVSCMHHYYPKSVSSALRYDWDNLVPLCQGCHFRHHNGGPSIHNAVNEIWGKEWLDRLNSKRTKIVKTNQQFYKDVIESLKNEDGTNKQL